jgi:hypothetical protein
MNDENTRYGERDSPEHCPKQIKTMKGGVGICCEE